MIQRTGSKDRPRTSRRIGRVGVLKSDTWYEFESADFLHASASTTRGRVVELNEVGFLRNPTIASGPCSKWVSTGCDRRQLRPATASGGQCESNRRSAFQIDPRNNIGRRGSDDPDTVDFDPGAWHDRMLPNSRDGLAPKTDGPLWQLVLLRHWMCRITLLRPRARMRLRSSRLWMCRRSLLCT